MKTKKNQVTRESDDPTQKKFVHAFIADVSPMMRSLVARMLSEDKRIKIVGSASDGWAALCYVSSLDPDLVVTDLNMPGLEGAEVTRCLKQRSNQSTIFVLTTDESAESRARCLTAGADAFLVKGPELSVQLHTAIQRFFPSG